MNGCEVVLKPIKELKDMNFYIPDYQRGYRWEPIQAIELMEDIKAFMEKKSRNDEIYCIQPLVVKKKQDDSILEQLRSVATVEDAQKLLKGSWDVVDGQQRLTTIYLLLQYLTNQLGNNFGYTIDYQTRENSRQFLANPQQSQKDDNIDYYYIYNVYTTIDKWFTNSQCNQLEFYTTLLNNVNFIWYQLGEDDDAIAAFTRLNIGKIALTDSELIKALFLNKNNYCNKSNPYKKEKLALDWDMIEVTLQNDEFWYFIQTGDYEKPTRIDMILDIICNEDMFELKAKKRKRNVQHINNEFENRIGSDNHRTFRYFYELFKRNAGDINNDWIRKKWWIIKKIYDALNEWYNDYRLYHYVGYLLCINKGSSIIKLYTKWSETTKDDFLIFIKGEIKKIIEGKEWINSIDTYCFEEGNHKPKTDCNDILLIHNIETIVSQNEKMVKDNKYNLPNFSKFPFHLYKKENWQVEHIRPNSGDNFKSEDNKKCYLALAKKYISSQRLCRDIDAFINGTSTRQFEDIINDINMENGPLPENAKNRIWNYTLLDESTNKEYGNAIFPIKRIFLSMKEQGFKVKYKLDDTNMPVERERVEEIAFVLTCTRNVFSKYYTEFPENMTAWTETDARSYLADLKDKLSHFR